MINVKLTLIKMLSTEPAKVSTRGGHGDMTAAEISSEASPIDNIRTKEHFYIELSKTTYEILEFFVLWRKKLELQRLVDLRKSPKLLICGMSAGHTVDCKRSIWTAENHSR